MSKLIEMMKKHEVPLRMKRCECGGEAIDGEPQEGFTVIYLPQVERVRRALEAKGFTLTEVSRDIASLSAWCEIGRNEPAKPVGKR